MKPEIYHADALEIVSSLGEFDYVITDPPYTTNTIIGSMKAKNSIIASKNMVDSISMSLIFNVLKSVLWADHFTVWIFCTWRQVSFYSKCLEHIGLGRQNCIVWNKSKNTIGFPYHRTHELILYASTEAHQVYAGIDYIEMKSCSNRNHPFEKPSGLINKCCGKFPPGRVLDPFCGTGGLLVGAQELGHEVVGIDIEEQFCKIARERLSKTQLSIEPC